MRWHVKTLENDPEISVHESLDRAETHNPEFLYTETFFLSAVCILLYQKLFISTGLGPLVTSEGTLF